MQWIGHAARVRLYINSAHRTMQQIRAETGCDVIINGGLYDMASFRPVCHLKADGKVLATDPYTYWGYGWNDDGALQLVTDYSALSNFIACVCLIRDGKKEALYYSKDVGGARARTAIGTMPDGQLWVYIGSNPQTPEALQETALLAGVRDAVMLDGGGSTQGILPGCMITSTRNVHNYICIWTREERTPLTIKQKLSNPNSYGGTRALSAIRYIVLHYTGNDGDSDEGNGTYFANNKTGTSAHYFVDDDSITQSVPDDRIAWHCGSKKYLHSECRNANSIGVELCDNKRDGTIYPSQAAIDRALELVRMLMAKYNIPADHVIRHYDVSGKLCPAYWCGTAAKDALWRSAFWSRLSGNTAPTPTASAGTVTITLPVLTRGSTGVCVQALQAILTGLGYDPHGVDGSFGPGCQAAVKRYQQDHGLTVDGTVGPATWRALLGA